MLLSIARASLKLPLLVLSADRDFLGLMEGPLLHDPSEPFLFRSTLQPYGNDTGLHMAVSKNRGSFVWVS